MIYVIAMPLNLEDLGKKFLPPRKSSGTRTDFSVAIGFVNSLN